MGGSQTDSAEPEPAPVSLNANACEFVPSFGAPGAASAGIFGYWGAQALSAASACAFGYPGVPPSPYAGGESSDIADATGWDYVPLPEPLCGLPLHKRDLAVSQSGGAGAGGRGMGREKDGEAGAGEEQGGAAGEAMFEAVGAFCGARSGWVFKQGEQGLGYYREPAKAKPSRAAGTAATGTLTGVFQPKGADQALARSRQGGGGMPGRHAS